MKRHHNLDYLRGLAAFGIMTFHYFSWSYGHLDAQSIVGRIGIYGVSIFYILSGLTLYLVYFDKMSLTLAGLADFFKKRILRIFPLLWLVIFAVLLLARKMPDLEILFLNLTGLFGFVKRDSYIPDGAWSIGNELVFYLFFPVFVMLTKKHKLLMAILGIIITAIYFHFSFVQLTNTKTLAVQWLDYINPFNQLFLFLSGFLIAHFFYTKSLTNLQTTIFLVVSVLLFAILPSEKDPIHIVTGVNRLAFTFICIIICLSFYKSNFILPGYLHRPLATLGEISYSVYLLHPLAFSITSIILNKFVPQYSKNLQLPLSVIFTLVASYFVYHSIEVYFMKLGRAKHVVAKNAP